MCHGSCVRTVILGSFAVVGCTLLCNVCTAVGLLTFCAAACYPPPLCSTFIQSILQIRSHPPCVPKTNGNSNMREDAAHYRWVTFDDPEPGPVLHFRCIFSGGERPTNFTVMGRGMPAPAWEGRQGTATALVIRGTTVPHSPTKNTLPQCLATSSANRFLPQCETSVYTRQYQRRIYSACMATPPLIAPL